MSTLTPTQSLILTTAIRDHDGQLVWFPDHLKGGARQKVLEGLAKRDLIAGEGDGWRVTAAGYEALGQTPPEAPTRDHSGASAVLLDEIDGGDPTDEELEAAHAAQVAHDERVNAIQAQAEADDEAPAEAKPRRTREDSKQATVIRMLKRPEGATLDQLMEVTGWQKHTVRGALSLLGKKQGIPIESSKTEAGRVYRVAAHPA
jgi:hypothetical protein